MSIRILVADDHAVFRSGLRALLENEKDLDVVAETGDGFETIRSVADKTPDILLLDISMPGLQGSRIAEEVLKLHPRPAIVVLTMHEDEYYLQELFKIGARGFVLKKSSGRELIRAIRAVSRGESYVDPSLGGSVISSYLGGRPQNEGKGRLDRLTRREQDVCKLLAYGHTNAEIAERLSISARTVETHRSNIMAKLELGTRADLVRFAIENGLMKLV
jgi:DNA-binding NarL/FixJ family response regulator